MTSTSSEPHRRFISLGQFTIAVEWSPESDLELAASGLSGDSDLDAGRIRVLSHLKAERQREVVFHELMHHAVQLTHLAARWDDDETEEVIRALSPWLVQAVTINNYEW